MKLSGVNLLGMEHWKKLFLLFFAGTLFAQADSGTALAESLFKDRQYFDLRDYVRTQNSDGSVEMLFFRGVLANRFNRRAESIILLQDYLKKASSQHPYRLDALKALADNLSKDGEYGRAADVYGAILDEPHYQLDERARQELKNVCGLWNALRDIPAQTNLSSGDSIIQGQRDKVNLLNVPVSVNGQLEAFVFDTGANLSIMTRSTALSLGLEVIDSNISVSSSTEKKIDSKLTVVPSLSIGNTTIGNVVFLVVEDQLLNFPQVEYQIKGIIGFPVLEALGKISITRDNAIHFSETPYLEEAEPNLCLDGLTPLVAATYRGRRLPFVFDTGATSSDFYPSFLLLEDGLADGPQKTMSIGGAGGSTEIRYLEKDLEIMVGGQVAEFPKARIMTESTNSHSQHFYGILGQDHIERYHRLTLDFRTMQLGFDKND